jgi:dTMP kinase
MTAARATGRFLVLEGIDGAGTTTQAERLELFLNGRGRRTLRTREPSDGPVGRLIRRFLAGDETPPPPDAMAMLFAADRFDHLSREIEPALADGVDVISDRYYLSSAAYQSQASARDEVLRLNRSVRRPDLTLVLAVDAEVAERRRQAAGRTHELYDALPLQRRIAEAYEYLARRPPLGERIVIVDGAASPEVVEQEICRAVAALPET